jgi:hypothetical protein
VTTYFMVDSFPDSGSWKDSHYLAYACLDSLQNGGRNSFTRYSPAPHIVSEGVRVGLSEAHPFIEAQVIHRRDQFGDHPTNQPVHSNSGVTRLLHMSPVALPGSVSPA